MAIRQALARTVLVTAAACALLSNAAAAHGQPPIPPPLGPDQESAEAVIISGYNAKQIQCTPDTPPNVQSISWDPPGFEESVGGAGMINDADPRLGGHFTAFWTDDRWDVEYEFC